ncbi:MAG TPA: hypothetical protein VMZ52_11605 [Bryobacteraceae bacterium]|nr:hypothetical protein [Bryobacteraceae bacterium]
MPRASSPIWRVVFVLLILCGFVYSQSANLSADHSDNHATHCCGICHVGHSPIVHAGFCLHFAPPSPNVEHHLSADGFIYDREPLVLDSPSRAPPA